MPEAAAIVSAAGGNLSPTTPFLLGAVAGGNLAPATPGHTAEEREAVAATAGLANAGENQIGDTFEIGEAVYTFVETPTVAGDVQGETNAAAVAAAINGTDGINDPHPLVRATESGGDVTITAVIPGSAGNGIALVYEGAVSVTWDRAETSGGSDAWPVSGTPALGTAAAGGNLAPTAPGLTQAAAGGNLSPTAPGAIV